MTQAIAKTDKNNLEALLTGDAFKQAVMTVLPEHLTPERIVKMALIAASRQPNLYKCTKESLLQSVMKSAELGLDCSGTLGRAYLIPFYNKKINAYECQFIPGYQGLIELARRSGNIARIESRVVYENDFFTIEYGLHQKLIHKPAFTNRGEIACVYAIAELTDGTTQIEVMTIEEVEAIRARSRAGNSGPWVTDFSEMARKTVIRRLAKYLPLSTEMAAAFEADDAQFDHGLAVANTVASATQARMESLRAELTAVPAPQLEESEEMPEEEEEIEEPQEEEIEEEAPGADPSQLTYEEAKDLVDEKVAEMDPADVKKVLKGRKIDQMDAKALLALHAELNKVG